MWSFRPAGLCLLATEILFALTSPLHATNLVYNGSFEFAEAGWQFESELGIELNKPSADGNHHVTVYHSLWQDIPTEAGKTYYVRFSGRILPFPTLTFGDQQVILISTNAFFDWLFVEGFAVASNSVTRLQFTGSGPIDDVRVIATDEPIQIITQPEARAVIEGGTVTFMVHADGGPPLFYQWHLDDEPIPGATDSTLIITNAMASDAGVYSVVVSNAVGALRSEGATLSVEAAPTSPIIVLQPATEAVPAGYGHRLNVAALGSEPLDYTWFLNGETISGGTNRVLEFPAIQAEQAGTYTVRVENSRGSVLSLPAVITVIDAQGGGLLTYNNTSSLVQRPIYDVDGVTLLAGTNFSIQVYAGASPTILRPTGERFFFYSEPLAGSFGAGTVVVPDVPPGQLAYVQFRIWETAAGVSYEDARARGGKFGSSPIAAIVATAAPPPPHSIPNATFKLSGGIHLFTTGRLEIEGRDGPDELQLKLVGAPGFRYLVEKRTPPHDWTPLLVVTNATGTVSFTDTDATAASAKFYRSRMLD